MMELFRKLVMDASTTPGVSNDYHRLHQLLHFLEFRIFSYIKFLDESLDDDNPENFYMEREWRVVGNLQFDLNDVQRVVIPSSYGGRLRSELPAFIGQLTFI